MWACKEGIEQKKVYGVRSGSWPGIQGIVVYIREKKFGDPQISASDSSTNTNVGNQKPFIEKELAEGAPLPAPVKNEVYRKKLHETTICSIQLNISTLF